MQKSNNESTGEFILYQTEDGHTRIVCRFEDNTIWLTQALMAELFQTTVANINLHIKNILAEGELTEVATIKDYLIVRSEGARQVRRPVKYYSLDMIIAVGYRVTSKRGTQFRIGATPATIRKFRIVRAANALPTSQNGGQRHRAMNPNPSVRNFRIAQTAESTCKRTLQVQCAAHASAPKTSWVFTS